MAYKSNLISGTIDLLVLSILNKKDCYAYEISKTISNNSNGLLNVSLNTVYTVTYKLEKENMVSEYSILVGRKRTRVYYHLEPSGKEYLRQLSADYYKMSEGVKNILDSLEGNNDE